MLIVGIFLVAFVSMVLAQQQQPQLPGGAQILINNSPLNEKGEIDTQKIGNLTTKAEERINAINLFFKEKLSWMRFIFGVTPELSWGFAMNFLLWVILFFFLFLVLPNFNISISIPTILFRLIGFGILVALSWFKVILKSAQLLDELAITWWGKALVVLILFLLTVILLGVQKVALKQKKRRDEIIKDINRDKRAAKIAKESAEEIVSREKGDDEDSEDEKEIEEEAEEEAESIKGMADEE